MSIAYQVVFTSTAKPTRAKKLITRQNTEVEKPTRYHIRKEHKVTHAAEVGKDLKGDRHGHVVPPQQAALGHLPNTFHGIDENAVGALAVRRRGGQDTSKRGGGENTQPKKVQRGREGERARDRGRRSRMDQATRRRGRLCGQREKAGEQL